MFVLQWIKVYYRDGGKDMLFIRHSEFWILSPTPKLSGWNCEKCLSNIEPNLLKLAIIESRINETLHFCELIARYGWFLKVLYYPAFPLQGTGVIRECIHNSDKRFHLKALTLLKRFKDNYFIIFYNVGVEICQRD